MSTRHSLSLLWIQVTEGDGIERVVSSEEEPVAQTSDKQNESQSGRSGHLPIIYGCHRSTQPLPCAQDRLSCSHRGHKHYVGTDRYAIEAPLKC